MNLKLANWIVGTMRSDAEIFDFIIEKDFELNACALGIPEIKDLEFLDEIMVVTKYLHVEIFELAFETRWWRENLLNYRRMMGGEDLIESSKRYA